MKAIIGLGNPEVKYMSTRHNAGFMVLDEILKLKNLRLQEKFNSFFVKDSDVIYLLPKTYMNLSGKAVQEIISFFKLDIKDILIVFDDISLPLGTLRFKPDGSSGGHNGIKSIIKETGFSSFNRLKVGIGPQPQGVPSERFVLSNFDINERPLLNEVIKIAASASLEWLESDIPHLQNKYNKQVISL